jgi:hypothetical protein
MDEPAKRQIYTCRYGLHCTEYSDISSVATLGDMEEGNLTKTHSQLHRLPERIESENNGERNDIRHLARLGRL